MTKRKAAAEKAHSTYRKSAPQTAAKKASETYRKTSAQFEEFIRDAQVPESMRTLAEKSVAQTRELCEHSLEAVLESWERFVDAGQGAVALNRKAIDIARHNINSGFGFAVSLTRAKNLAEIMELQAAYWRKQLGELAAQAGEIRTLSTKVTADAVAPIKGADNARHQRPTGNDLSHPKGPFRSNTELQGRKASAFHSTQRKSLHSIPHTCGGLGVHARPKTCRYH